MSSSPIVEVGDADPLAGTHAAAAEASSRKPSRFTLKKRPAPEALHRQTLRALLADSPATFDAALDAVVPADLTSVFESITTTAVGNPTLESGTFPPTTGSPTQMPTAVRRSNITVPLNYTFDGVDGRWDGRRQSGMGDTASTKVVVSHSPHATAHTFVSQTASTSPAADHMAAS